MTSQNSFMTTDLKTTDRVTSPETINRFR